MNSDNFDALADLVKRICDHVSIFIDEKREQHVIQHNHILLCSLEKNYFNKKEVDKSLRIIDESSKFLLKSKSQDYSGLVLEHLRKASEIAEKNNFLQKQAEFNSQIGDICSSGIVSTPSSPANEERSELVDEALFSYHQAIRNSFDNKLSFDKWSSNIIKLSALEIRQYYLLLRDFLLDQSKIAKKQGGEAVEAFFRRIDKFGEKLIELNEYDKAWNLYMSTQSSVAENIDISYLSRFAQLGQWFITPSSTLIIDQPIVVSEEKHLYHILDNIQLPGYWKQYKSQLEKNREIYNNEDIVKAEEFFIDSTKKLIHEILDDCFAMLGPAPCQYAFCCCGSLANKTICPYSDLEYALLIQDVSNFSGTEKLYIRNYFVILNKLFSFKVNSIGEVSPAGFHLDSEGYPLVESRLMGTPEELLAHTSLQFANSLNDHLSFSIYHISFLYGSESLFDRFSLLRKKWLLQIQDNDCLHRKVGIAFLKYHLQTFHAFDCDFDKSIDIKKTFYLLLNSIILDLAIYNNFAATDYQFNFYSAFIKLRTQHKLTNEFATMIDFAFHFILRLRTRVQRLNRQQLELVYYSKGEGVQLTTEEHNQLKGIYYGVLLPLFWAIDQLLEFQQWHSDPATVIFMDNVQALSDKSKPFNKQSLHDAISVIIYSYALNKASPSKYYSCLTQLPDIHHAYFVTQVIEAEQMLNPDKLRLKRIVTVLNYFPQEDGRRPQIDLNTETWFKLLKALVVGTKPGGYDSIYLDSISSDEKGENSIVSGYLNGDITKQIISQQSTFFDDDIGYVCKIQLGEEVFYLKKHPYAPGVEFATNLFNQYFFGLDFFRSELFRFKVGVQNPIVFPVTIVGGDFKNLEHFKQFDEHLNLDEFDKNVFSLSVMSALLTNVNDISEGNTHYLRFVNKENISKFTFISPFREACFSPIFINKTNTIRNPQLELHTKTILFAQKALMQRPIPKDTKNEFCRLEVSRVLDNWLLTLKNQYTSYMRLLGHGDTHDIDRWVGEYNQKYFSYFFSEEFLYILYDKIVLMQKIFKEYKNITHDELIVHMEPILGFYYAKVLPEKLKKLPTPISTKQIFSLLDQSFVLSSDHFTYFVRKECRFFQPIIPSFEQFDEQFVRRKPAKIYYDLISLRQDALRIQEAKTRGQFADFELYNQLGLPESRDKVIRAIDLSLFDDIKTKVLLKVLSRKSHKRLHLQNCKYLKDSDLLHVLKASPGLLELNLQGCEGLSSIAVNHLAGYSRKLKKLNISALGKVLSIGVAETKNTIHLKELNELRMNDCSSLKRVNIFTPKLQYLFAKNSASLESIQVNSSQLAHVCFDGSPNLTTSTLVSLLKHSDSMLDRVDLKGCIGIKLNRLYEIYLSLNYTEMVPTKLAALLMNPTYTDIDLSGSQLNRFHLIAIMKYISERGKPINTLNLSECSFTLDAEKLLIIMLNKQVTVKTLIMNAVKTQQQLENIIVDILIENHSIISLHLEENNLDDEAIKFILPYLKAIPFFWELNLRGNRITDQGVTYLCLALCAKPNLGKVNLADNQVDISGLHNIFANLKSSNGLIHCSIENNPCFIDTSDYFEGVLAELSDKNYSLINCSMLNESMDGLENTYVGMKKSSNSLMIKQVQQANKRRDSRTKAVSKRITVAEAQLNKELLDQFIRLQGKIKDFINKNLDATEELIQAVIMDDLNKVRELLDKGVSPIAVARTGNTALHAAARCSKTAILEYFFSYTVNVSATNGDNETIFDLHLTEPIRTLINDYRSRLIEEVRKRSIKGVSKSSIQDTQDTAVLSSFLLRWFPHGLQSNSYFEDEKKMFQEKQKSAGKLLQVF